ncbi:TPA: hypothetical protein ACFP4Q_000789 [Neisseria weaveri]
MIDRNIGIRRNGDKWEILEYIFTSKQEQWSSGKTHQRKTIKLAETKTMKSAETLAEKYRKGKI